MSFWWLFILSTIFSCLSITGTGSESSAKPYWELKIGKSSNDFNWWSRSCIIDSELLFRLRILEFDGWVQIQE